MHTINWRNNAILAGLAGTILFDLFRSKLWVWDGGDMAGIAWVEKTLVLGLA